MISPEIRDSQHSCGAMKQIEKLFRSVRIGRKWSKVRSYSRISRSFVYIHRDSFFSFLFRARVSVRRDCFSSDLALAPSNEFYSTTLQEENGTRCVPQDWERCIVPRSLSVYHETGTLHGKDESSLRSSSSLLLVGRSDQLNHEIDTITIYPSSPYSHIASCNNLLFAASSHSPTTFPWLLRARFFKFLFNHPVQRRPYPDFPSSGSTDQLIR